MDQGSAGSFAAKCRVSLAGGGRRCGWRGHDVIIGWRPVVVIRWQQPGPADVRVGKREADLRVRASAWHDRADDLQLGNKDVAARVVLTTVADVPHHRGQRCAVTDRGWSAAMRAGNTGNAVLGRFRDSHWVPPVFSECDPAPNWKKRGRRRMIAPSAVSTSCASTSARLCARGEAPG